MTPKSTRTSHASLVPIDPVVASQITVLKSAMQPPGHTRTESTPAKGPRGLAVSHPKGHGRNNSAPSRHHNRSNSLRHAKNSTEMLRQRSTKRDGYGAGDLPADPKRGRNFTVTNVGIGGMLYLRPSTHQRPMSPALSPHPLTPWTAPATTLVVPPDNESVLLSTEHTPLGRGPTMRTRSVSPKRLMERFNRAKGAQARTARPKNIRSQSFSTVDESRRSISESAPKTLKIIINRADPDRPKTAESHKPTLEIPIPHYRLGNPRFSTNGTPVLRSSTFTRSSSMSSARQANTAKTEVPLSAPPPSSLRAFAKLQNLDSHTDPTLNSTSHPPIKSNPPASHRQSAVSSIGAAASIYDELSEVYDDPSVVRFAHNIRDITAATPARIIAQISSESFMDYELVSDFFLTFRSYMSAADVLDLLLARLKWAIGRMTDDGRIIRIRTFAALRHWILNYFMDDFVPTRHLRVRFCDEVNDMYDDVKRQYMGVQSDLKILQDLKRCWNGRCSLYWDGDEFSMDGDPDDEIFPGGVLGSRNPDYIDPSEIKSTPGRASLYKPPRVPFTSLKINSPSSVQTLPNRQQKPSLALSNPAGSVQSDRSIQPNSCSMILSASRAGSDNSRSLKGPVPVSVLSRRQNAPTELTVATNLSNGARGYQRRGGNSIDSTRERTPVEPPRSAILLPEPHEGSIIRGFVYAPVEPFVQLPAHLPQSPFGRFDLTVTSPSTKVPLEYSLGSNAPAVKNIFGSIRRALSGKQGASEVALITVSNQGSTQTIEAKKSPLPLSMSRSSDELRKKGADTLPKSNIRIDLLCAAAMESYQSGMPRLQDKRPSDARTETLIPAALFPPPPMFLRPGDGNERPSRVSSHASAQSGSILIVNDTDSEIPVMSGAIQPVEGALSQRTRSSIEHYLPEENASFETQIAFQDEAQVDQTQYDANSEVPNATPKTQPAPPQPSTPEQPNRVLSSIGSSNTMRNRVSLSSSVPPNRILGSPGATVSLVTPPQDYHDGTNLSSPKAPAHTLRRRPGGDLRKNQNVHDMEPVNPHHESVDSLADMYSNGTDSLLATSAPIQAQQVVMQQAKKVSMINTHSSQHLRPSFEAAVAGFMTIPDDDDGGLEATLLKLEGKYEKSPEIGSYSPLLEGSARFSADDTSLSRQDAIPSSSPTTGREFFPYDVSAGPVQQPVNRMRGHNHDALSGQPVFGLQIRSLTTSEASVDSVPLLKRDIDEPYLPEPVRKQGENVHNQHASLRHGEVESRETHAARGPSPGSYLTADNSNTHSDHSVLEDDARSDLSSEISVDIINYSEALGGANSPLLVAPGTAVSGLEIPSHPLAHSSFVNISLHPSLALDSKPIAAEPGKDSAAILLKIGTGDTTVVRGGVHDRGRLKVQRGENVSAGPAHAPFVLACDSQMLAQQLTLVEQSALTEIEWADLVEMRWSNTASPTLDWAEYVAHHNVKGVDLVITRFNLMVKWALSQIVLTQDMEERVRVITKFIHVAAHARRLHNYATMLQLTIALTSTDSTRMTQTWDLVPGPDKSLLKNMEALIQPIRNFHDLRLEMESADLSDGCVPFIGLYIHDLTYNAQKPTEIDIGKSQPPLINFERFRTTAIIVKGLLRLIDASSRYGFEPIPGVIERCLWIAALPDERVRFLSKSLQQ